MRLQEDHRTSAAHRFRCSVVTRLPTTCPALLVATLPTLEGPARAHAGPTGGGVVAVARQVSRDLGGAEVPRGAESVGVPGAPRSPARAATSGFSHGPVDLAWPASAERTGQRAPRGGPPARWIRPLNVVSVRCTLLGQFAEVDAVVTRITEASAVPAAPGAPGATPGVAGAR